MVESAFVHNEFLDKRMGDAEGIHIRGINIHTYIHTYKLYSRPKKAFQRIQKERKRKKRKKTK